ncbi:MAG: heavy metal translocating P-type ATPase, partial [Spirochaetales bacterium]
MSTNPEMKKFQIQGLDCAQCANNIEVALRKVEGFEGATVNFATNTIVLPANQRTRAEKVVSRIEPGASIVDRDAADADLKNAASDGDRFWGGRVQIARIGIALILSVVGIAFAESLRSTPYRIAEYALFLTAYLLVGWPVLAGAGRNIVRGRVFDELFLMSIATIGAIIINEMAEAVAVMLFYSLGEYIQDRAVGKSRRSIAALMDLRPESARVVSEEGLTSVDPRQVEVGTVIEVRAGERVPLDGEIIRGESAVDTSALTGESMPRSVEPGDQVLSGFVNESGLLRVRVTKPLSESSVSRILELVEDAAARKAPTEKFISKFARVYTPIVVAVAAAIALLPPLLIPGATLSTWVYRALVALVISCPCALVISIPLGYLGGIGGAARSGILVKGANYLDSIKDLSTVVFDKTGTLTRGVFRVTATVPRNGYTREQLLQFAAIAESRSSHPIARSIRAAAGGDAAAGEDARAGGVSKAG